MEESHQVLRPLSSSILNIPIFYFGLPSSGPPFDGFKDKFLLAEVKMEGARSVHDKRELSVYRNAVLHGAADDRIRNGKKSARSIPGIGWCGRSKRAVNRMATCIAGIALS
jgi:hypothetical protein